LLFSGKVNGQVSEKKKYYFTVKMKTNERFLCLSWIRYSHIRSWTPVQGLPVLCTMTLRKVEEGVRPRRATKLCSVVVDPTRKFKCGLHHQLLPPFSGSNFLASTLVFNIFISRCPLQLILKL